MANYISFDFYLRLNNKILVPKTCSKEAIKKIIVDIIDNSKEQIAESFYDNEYLFNNNGLKTNTTGRGAIVDKNTRFVVSDTFCEEVNIINQKDIDKRVQCLKETWPRVYSYLNDNFIFSTSNNYKTSNHREDCLDFISTESYGDETLLRFIFEEKWDKSIELKKMEFYNLECDFDKDCYTEQAAMLSILHEKPPYTDWPLYAYLYEKDFHESYSGDQSSIISGKHLNYTKRLNKPLPGFDESYVVIKLWSSNIILPDGCLSLGNEQFERTDKKWPMNVLCIAKNVKYDYDENDKETRTVTETIDKISSQDSSEIIDFIESRIGGNKEGE